MSVQDESPVRGMVPMRDFLKLMRENDELRELLALQKDKPPLTAEDFNRARGSMRPIGGQLREPRPASRNGRILAVIRANPDGITTRELCKAIDGTSTGTMSAVVCELRQRGYVRNASTAGVGKEALWKPMSEGETKWLQENDPTARSRRKRN